MFAHHFVDEKTETDMSLNQQAYKIISSRERKVREILQMRMLRMLRIKTSGFIKRGT